MGGEGVQAHNLKVGGHHVRVYIDELTHTSKAKTGN